MKSKSKIDIGYRVGHLTVEEKTSERQAGYIVWVCRCDCGGKISLDTRYLQRGTVTDCGCISKVRPGQIDLTGKRFGKLVCKEITEQRNRNGSVVWICECDCGNKCFADSSQLISGNKKSCGCLSHPPLKDFIGKRFGMLKVIDYSGKKSGMHRWKCLCDCGNETIVGQTLLQSGKTKSCGCLQATVYSDNLKLIDGTSITILESVKNRIQSNNSSGFNGVYLNKNSGKWIAQITFKGKTYHLGSYDEIEDAVEARKKGEEMHDKFLEWYYNSRNAKESQGHNN